MRTNQRIGHQIQSLLLVSFLISGGALAGSRQDAAPATVPAPAPVKEHPEKIPGYKEFLKRVRTYMSTRKSIESTLPSLKQTDQPEIIAARQQELAKKIHEARPDAKPGDIFTEDATKAFRHSIHEEFRGPQGKGARTTIRQGEPLKEMHLPVNEPYPDGVSFTTVPPTLLLKFPKLPDHVAYRIVSHDLILIDVDANLVVDRISDIIP
jgi:hypothetical protein